MIVGGGMLARAFEHGFSTREDVLVFASGVSNSQTSDAQAFEREAELLRSALAHHRGTVVYFGSCSIGDADRRGTPYARHKAAMESQVLEHAGGLVLRLPQVVGNTANPHTLTNFLCDRILRGERFSVWQHAERNLVDVDDVVRIGTVLIERHDTPRAVTIAARESVTMVQLVALFESTLGRRAVFSLEPRGAPLPVDAAEADRIASALGIDLGNGYTERLIGKYYAQHR